LPDRNAFDGVYRHETRPWEWIKRVSTDTYSSDGMQLSASARAAAKFTELSRATVTLNGLNGEFLDVKARFAHGFINS
jgi:NADH dehydrogenase/NADH:ubiquinone oxidoreductase subunit G